MSRVLRTGDGLHRDYEKLLKSKESLNHNEEFHDQNHFWGFGDKDMTAEDMKRVEFVR